MWCNAGNMGFIGWTLMVLLWGGVAALAVWAVRSGGASRAGSAPDARQLLDRRLASGEIGRDEYEELRGLVDQRGESRRDLR